MTPLRYVVLGLVLVFLDLTIGSFDLIPDPIGWALIVFGLGPFALHERLFITARSIAGAGLVASVVLLFATGFLGILAADIVQVAFVFTFCTALMRTVADTGLRTNLDRVRWLDLGLTTGSIAMLVLGLAPVSALLVLADVIVVGWLLLTLWSRSDDPLFLVA